ncbi:MAG TPA: 4Fe-4S binding protein [Gemmatimonadales bacterium]|nr:4Fe-4S binding protein [Gemmatimonadales bacterium]
MTAGFERHAQGDAALLVNRAWCKGCNVCVAACPSGILALDAAQRIVVTDINRCIFCGVCAVRCPDFVFILERPAARVEDLEAVA